MAVLLVGILFLPQLDPFGKEKEREEEAQRHRALKESQKAAALRLALLKKSNPKAKTSEEVKRAVDELKQTFHKMKPADKKGNLKRLTRVQKDLGELWRKRSEKRLKDAFSRAGGQRLGAGRSQKADRWKRRLQRGDASGIKKELEEIQRKAGEIQKTSDPAERRRLEQEMRQQLKGLSDFLANNASSKSLQDAVRRALEQLTMAADGKLSKEAMKALQQSLDLTNMELDSVAQAIRDLEALQQGLKAAQLAKQLNQLKGLDGAACEGLKSIEDYAEFYRKLVGGG
jgi:hypothetical protein